MVLISQKLWVIHLKRSMSEIPSISKALLPPVKPLSDPKVADASGNVSKSWILSYAYFFSSFINGSIKPFAGARLEDGTTPILKWSYRNIWLRVTK